MLNEGLAVAGKKLNWRGQGPKGEEGTSLEKSGACPAAGPELNKDPTTRGGLKERCGGSTGKERRKSKVFSRKGKAP